MLRVWMARRSCVAPAARVFSGMRCNCSATTYAEWVLVVTTDEDFALALDALDKTHDGRIILLQHAPVAVAQVHRPRNDRHRVRPRRAAVGGVLVWAAGRNPHSNQALFALRITDVEQPF